MYGGNAATVPAPARSIHGRIAALRETCPRAVNAVSWLSLLILIPALMGILQVPFTLITMVLAESSGINEEVLLFFNTIGLFSVSVLLSFGLMLLVRIWLRRSFANWHAQAWQELHVTNLAVLVVDNTFAELISNRVMDIYGLSWLSPPPPRKLEEQIEYCACYHTALKKLLWGVGRLENGPLWEGGLAGFAGTSRGCTCGCLSLWVLSLLGAGLVIFGSVLHLKRCAVQAAYCDFLLKGCVEGNPE